MVARRDNREKASLPMDGIGGRVVRLLDEIQQALYDRALKYREEHTQRVSTYEEFKAVMEGRPGFVIAGWCGSAECETAIKAETQATVRNIPFGAERVALRGPQGDPEPGRGVAGTCIKCGGASSLEAWFAKSY
jgi:prolyl-tRNA synthetase